MSIFYCRFKLERIVSGYLCTKSEYYMIRMYTNHDLNKLNIVKGIHDTCNSIYAEENLAICDTSKNK